ncbi:MAG: hypothetical protein AAGF68_10240 [Pseudomonadota bacterium]
MRRFKSLWRHAAESVSCFLCVLLVILGLTPSIGVTEPQTPPPGTALRAALLDAVRPLAAYDLGAPIEFRVIELRVEGDRAFGRMTAQRPGGAAIDPAETPMHLRDGVSLDLFDGPRLEVFFHEQDGAWRVVEYVIGATDAWWYGYDCDNYGVFFPRFCED